MWRGAGSASALRLPRGQVCPGEAGPASAAEAVLMVLPSQLSWREARDQCRRLGGGLHLDTSAEEVSGQAEVTVRSC